MSKMGNETMVELAKLLKSECCLAKTAAKKEKIEECEKCECEPCKCKKTKKKVKKSKAMQTILDELTKLADTLDESGSLEAANLVDDALKEVSAGVWHYGRDDEEDFGEPPAPHPEPTDEEAENIYGCTCEKGKMCDMCEREAKRVTEEAESFEREAEFHKKVMTALQALKQQNPSSSEALDYALELVQRKQNHL